MALTLKKKKDPGAAPPEKAPRAPRKKRSGPAVRKSGRTPRFALLIGDEGSILIYMEGNKVIRRLFAPSPQPTSTEAMVTLMRSHPKVPLALLVDNLDQQYIRQSFPPVSSLSVNGLVKRRLDRDFQPEDLKGSLPLGRDKSGRKEWNFLLISLAKTAVLTEWIELVSELPNEMTGIFLMPVEATLYLQMLTQALEVPAPKSWQLLVTHNKVSGFRQVVTNQGKLVFTRVSQAIDDAIPAVIAGNIEQEIINTIEYLRRLGFQDASGLDILVIASQDVNEALDLKRFNMGYSQAVTPLDVADALGFEQAALSADRFGDVVMAAAFLRTKKRVLRFSTAYVDSLAKLYLARRMLMLVTGLIALLLLGLSAENLFTMSKNNATAKESEAKRTALQGQLVQLKKNVAGLNENLSMKAAVVSAYDSQLKAAHLPMDFVKTLMGVVTPEQRILTFEWTDSSAKKTNATSANAPGTSSASGPLGIKVTFDFKGVYNDIEELSKAEQVFIDTLKTRLPDYTITHDPFPWLKENDKSLEISFDQKQPPSIREGDTRLVITFVGPKKADGDASGMARPGVRP